MIIISNIIYITILVLLLLTSVILIAKLARNSYRLHYTTILKSITDVPTPVCIVNMSNNKIIAGNELMCKLFNLDKMSDIDITSLNLFTDRFENYLDIKNICKYSTDKYHQRFIHITINNMPKIFKIKFSKIKIGYKNFIIFIINDKTEIVNYIKKLGIFTNVVDEASEGILITKFSEKENMFPIIRYANPAIKEITGYSSKEIINKPLVAIFENNVNEEILDKLSDNLKKRIPTTIEYQYIKKNGEICWIISEIVPITHKNVYSTLVEKDNTKLLGNISEDDFKDIDIYITLYHRDITDRKRYNTTNKALIDKLYKTIKNKNKYLNVIEDILEFADNKVKDNMNYTKMLIDTIGSNIDVNRCYIFKLEKIVSDNKPMKTMFNLMYCWFDEDGANKDGDCKFELLDNMFVEDIGAYEMYSSLVMDKTFTIKANSDDSSLAYKIWIDNNTKNTLIQPIFNKDRQLIGFIGLDDVENENREWDSSVYKLLKIAAKSLGNII